MVIGRFVDKDIGNENTLRSLLNTLPNESRSNVYSFPTPSRLQKVATEAEVDATLNPCQKPKRLIMKIIHQFSKIESSVLDLCSGTGTVAVACMLLNRNCTSIENEQIQFSLLPSRVNVAYNHCRTHINTETGRSPIHKKGVDALNTEIDVEI
jgi:DNA modification methylase